MWIPVGLHVDEEAICNESAGVLTEACMFRTWPIYQRDKWGHGEEAICEALLPLFLHVLQPAYDEFDKLQRGRGERSAAGQADHQGGPVAEAEGADEEGAEGADEDPRVGPIVPARDDAAPVNQEESQMRERNAKARVKTKRWLRSTCPTPLGGGMALRFINHVTEGMQRDEFYIGSKRWNQKQEARASILRQTSRKFLCRDYPLLVAARGEIEFRALQKLRLLLFNGQLWMLLPSEDFTNEFKSKVFWALSNVGGLTERLLASPHADTPFLLFLTLQQPELLDTVLDRRACRNDVWTRRFLAKYDPRSLIGKLILRLHLLIAHMNTNRLEATNSKLARFEKKRVQCQQVDVSGLSSFFVGTHFRSDEGCDPPPNDYERADPGDCAEEEVEQGDEDGPFGGGGGPWRTFVHWQQSNNLREVGRCQRIETLVTS